MSERTIQSAERSWSLEKSGDDVFLLINGNRSLSKNGEERGAIAIASSLNIQEIKVLKINYSK